MKCSNCNNVIPKDSKICPICGTIFASYFEDLLLTRKQRVRLFFHRIAFVIPLMFLVIIVLAIFIFRHNLKMSRLIDLSMLSLDQTSVNYVNDLYVSDGRYYKYLLNNNEKKLYDVIFESIKNYDETITIDLSPYNLDSKTFTTDTLRNIKHVLSMDHPELINLGTINVYSIEGTTAKLIVNYAVSKEEYEVSVNSINEILSTLKNDTLELSQYETVKYIYDYFQDKLKYTDEKDTKYYSAYGCFLLDKCNLYGYAKTLQIVLTNVKINSLLAVGTVDNAYYEWNIVKIENEYYFYDQMLTNYKGFLFKSNNYKMYHKNMMPSINGKKYLMK